MRYHNGIEVSLCYCCTFFFLQALQYHCFEQKKANALLKHRKSGVRGRPNRGGCGCTASAIHVERLQTAEVAVSCTALSGALPTSCVLVPAAATYCCVGVVLVM